MLRCTECGAVVADRDDLIDGLCDDCVDKLLSKPIPANDGGYGGKPMKRRTRRSAYNGSIAGFATREVGDDDEPTA